jgi:sucrose-6-phosphate hydrolase SacC (GH32 family)
MNWQKHGLVFGPSGNNGWMQSHAQVPTPLVGDGFIRIYFSSRPEPNLSLTTFVDLDANDPARVLRLNPTPILEVGKPGTFDEHGIMPSCAVKDGEKVFLYYSGWSRGASVPYTNSTGLAVSEDGGETFWKLSEGPILGKGIHDPYSATSPCVLKEDNVWHMWYCSGTGWLEIGGKYEHTYDIKYARSNDGINWSPQGTTTLSPRTEFEALTRPFVTRRPDGYHMWFCYRGSHDFRDGEDAYKIGYASSTDLNTWQRNDDEAGIAPSETGWDSRMVAYPAVVTLAGQTLMFYNGNGFGYEGFGYASLGPNL